MGDTSCKNVRPNLRSTKVINMPAARLHAMDRGKLIAMDDVGKDQMQDKIHLYTHIYTYIEA